MKPAATSNKFQLLLFLVQSISHFFSTRLTMIDSKLKLFDDDALVFILKGTCSTNKSKSFFISTARDSINSLIVKATRRNGARNICTRPSRDQKSLKSRMHHLRPHKHLGVNVDGR